MTSPAFEAISTVVAATKRSPTISGGKRGTPATEIAYLKCTPLDPVDAELRSRFGLETPNILLQTFVDGGLDIIRGDVLTVDSTDYPIRAVSKYTWEGSDFRHLILEELVK